MRPLEIHRLLATRFAVLDSGKDGPLIAERFYAKLDVAKNKLSLASQVSLRNGPILGL